MPSPPVTHANMETPFTDAIPSEIRLQIYAYLVFPQRHAALRSGITLPDTFAHGYSGVSLRDHMHLRNLDPANYSRESAEYPGTSYSVRADRFRGRCMPTTYHCINPPHMTVSDFTRLPAKLQSRRLHKLHNPAILRVNHQIYRESVELFYGHHTFDFDTHIEALVPFLRDIGPFARSCIKKIRIVKRALPYDKDFDKCEWRAALSALHPHGNSEAITVPNLRHLTLGIVAGRPEPKGWDDVQRISAGEFNALKDRDDFEWLRPLCDIRGLQTLDVQAVVEHCPPATSSSAMEAYISFSASVEGGFRKWLTRELVKEDSKEGR